MSNEYQALMAPAFAEFEEKRSRFLCYLYPVVDRESVNQHLSDLRIKYPDARHHCSAYVIGGASQPKTQGFNDDGEPSGTAGKPMLNVLTQRGAGDSAAIVVRYFGGIKLGAGGLVRAYGAAVSMALDSASFIDKYPQEFLSVTAPFADEGAIRREVDKFQGGVISATYMEGVTLEVEIERRKVVELKEGLIRLTAGKAKFSDVE